MAVIEATEENFDQLVQGAEYVMVDFYGDNCGACVGTAPYYREVADDMAFIRFIQVNTSVYREHVCVPETGQEIQDHGHPGLPLFPQRAGGPPVRGGHGHRADPQGVGRAPLPR